MIPCLHNARFIPVCIRVWSSDPVRVLRLFHNNYAGYNWSIYCWDFMYNLSLPNLVCYCTIRSTLLVAYVGATVLLSRCECARTVLCGALYSCLCDRSISCSHIHIVQVSICKYRCSKSRPLFSGFPRVSPNPNPAQTHLWVEWVLWIWVYAVITLENN